MSLKGCFTAMVTPFLNGAVDWDTLGLLVDAQVAAGIDGLAPVGSTGESSSLGYDDHIKVIEFVIERVAGRCKVLAGAGANTTEEAVFLAGKAKELGVDATLQVTPYYNKPTQEGLYRHFSMVADKVGLPIVLYNVPSRSGVSIGIDTIARLATNPHVIAVKEAGGSVDRVSQILDACEIGVLSGDDSLTLPMISVGARGVVSVASNIIPAEMTLLVKLANDGDFLGALELHRKFFPLFRDEFIETNPIPIKAAMAILGQLKEEYRLPLCEIGDDHRVALKETLKKIGLL